jgi:hypothetical protein
MGEGPPESRDGANNHERAESKAAANLARVYPAHELAATGNNLEQPATTGLAQGRFAFDTGEPFNDPRIAAYHVELARELTDDQLKNFMLARYAYEKYQRLGTPECRRFAWSTVQRACSLSAKNPRPIHQGTSSKTPINDPGASNRSGGKE